MPGASQPSDRAARKFLAMVVAGAWDPVTLRLMGGARLSLLSRFGVLRVRHSSLPPISFHVSSGHNSNSIGALPLGKVGRLVKEGCLLRVRWFIVQAKRIVGSSSRSALESQGLILNAYIGTSNILVFKVHAGLFVGASPI